MSLLRSIFVYGSLRPDDDSGMPWTKEACDGMNYCKAIVKDHCMYIDTYASVKSNKIGIIGVGEGSTEHFGEFINFTGITPKMLIKETDATLKYGVVFEN